MAKKKLDFKKIAMNALVSGASGAVAQIASEAINMTDPQNTDYILIVAGAVLPEIIKNDMAETAGNSLIAVGAYRLAERNDLAGKLGLGNATDAPATSGLGFNNIGEVWNKDRKTVYADKTQKNKGSKPTVDTAVM
jgi:hypothetical protein